MPRAETKPSLPTTPKNVWSLYCNSKMTFNQSVTCCVSRSLSRGRLICLLFNQPIFIS
ncbi:unnamed protein product [Schistosoma margrebowiei]|uniref:Uncharacterized protein n=1 Tax=Schistosoma margrebowiei TaxID=48269 RepID=A0A183LM40_9TREM|nr:unnamed protein product [Schistosoma margrebowiei]